LVCSRVTQCPAGAVRLALGVCLWVVVVFVYSVPELEDFLRTNYPDAYGKTEAESSERFETLDDLMKPRTVSLSKRRFRYMRLLA